MAMRLPAVTGQALFTIEQIELLRRLRNSGLTKEQITNAFEALERLDRELGPVYNIPITQVANAVTFQQMQAQATQVANQVASQLALSAQVAKAAQVAQATVHTLGNQQPVFPHPIAIAPIPTSAPNLHNVTPKAAVSEKLPSASQNGSAPAACSLPGPPSVSPPPLTISDPLRSRKRSPSSDTNDSVNGEPVQKMVQVNGSVMVPAELTNQRASPTNAAKINEVKLEGIPEISDTNEEFLEFMAKGERACCEEIKEFVQKYNIRQQQIATLSGISQPYISRFLRGEFSEMSPRSRRIIIKWYIAYKNHPTAIGMCQSYISRFLRGEYFDMSGRSRQSIIKWYLAYKNCPNSIATAVSAVLMANGHPPAKRFISALDVSSGEFVNTPRRERFVFRPNHVVILEKYFAEDSYPSYEKREEIARTLNASTEASTGKQLEEREIVTAQIISNWFANKRKEMKKIAREEGLDVSQVPIRPRGRPSGRFFLSSLIANEQAAVDASQATDLSLQHVTDLSMQQVTDLVLPQATDLSLQSVNAGGGNLVATDLTLESNLVEKDANDNEAATDLSMNGNRNATAERDGNMSTPDLQDVELAAVNQAILSLTGQTAIGIKMEKPDSENDSKGVES